ncbi:hypothetical protein HID58_034141 [Brassica napus]|uniref:Uncharacterized protein n=1 Tax=Brassica napus TaxID=3708 RepID=A0ABQ8C180_BRANA|nr:hypothetical protein HID58_034141 [Brassica napus]
MPSAPAWVSHSPCFMMSFNDASSCPLPPLGRATPGVFWTSLDDLSPLLKSPLPWAWYIARKSGGIAAVFPALGQGSFRGTTPMEFDWRSIHLAYFQELLFWLFQLLEFVKVVILAVRCYALLEDLLSFSYVAEL